MSLIPAGINFGTEKMLKLYFKNNISNIGMFGIDFVKICTTFLAFLG